MDDIKSELKAIFQRYDKNGDGTLDLDEFHAIFQNMKRSSLSRDDVTALCQQMDKNHDGKVDFDEFLEYVFSSHTGKFAEVPPSDTLSLAQFLDDWDAHVVVISCPEVGPASPPNKDSKGKEVFDDIHVMRILEALPTHLKKNINFSLGVDFRNSTSSDLIAETLRWAPSGGKDEPHYVENGKHKPIKQGVCMTGADDLNIDWGHYVKKGDDKYKFAVRNSFWFMYWSGKVSGALSSALASAKDVPTDDNKFERAFKCSGLHVRPKDHKFARVVVAVSIDGGPITQVEKQHIPEICRNVVSDARRRGYSWAADVFVVWAHFPSVVDFINNLNGLRNLVKDKTRIVEDPAEAICLDSVSSNTVYKVKTDGKCVHGGALERLLISPIETVMSGGADVSEDSFCKAMIAQDFKTVRFILEKAPHFNVNALCDKKYELNALFYAKEDLDIYKLLLDRKVNPNHVNGDHKGTPLSQAISYHGGREKPNQKYELVKLLMDHRADTSIKVQSYCPKEKKTKLVEQWELADKKDAKLMKLLKRG